MYWPDNARDWCLELAQASRLRHFCFFMEVFVMKIALASAPVINRNIEFNLQEMIDAIEDCSGKTDLVLFGESVMQGFDSLCWDYETDRMMAVSVTDAPIRRMKNVVPTWYQKKG